MKKRILALLTAAVMLLSAVPALADETAVANDGYAEVIVAEDFDYYAGSNKPTLSSATTASDIYYGQKYFGGMSGGRGGVFTQMDFGEGADKMVLDVKMAYVNYYDVESNLSFKAATGTPVDEDADGIADNSFGFSGNYVATAEAVQTGGYENFQIKHYPVTDVERLKGIVNINMYVYSGSRYSNVYSFQFNKAVNPYQELLAADEKISSAKEIKSLDFGVTGADEVTLTYNQGATGTVSIYKDTINGYYLTDSYLVDTITLDGTGAQTVALDRTKYLDYADLYFAVSDGVELSQIAFSEYEMPDNFDGKTEINAVYIGNGDWSKDAKAVFEEENALDGRTFKDTYYNLEDMTDIEYLDFLSNDFAGADILFVQAGDRTEGILDALTYLDAPAKTVVIGDASYASRYGVAAAAADELALPETYAVPESKIREDAYAVINTIDNDFSSGPAQENTSNHTNKWTNNQYVVFENARFTHGIKEVKIAYAHKSTVGSMKISLDGKDDGILVADFQEVPTNASWGPPYAEATQLAVNNVSGIHDIYAYTYTSAGFGNFSTIQFVPYDYVTSEMGMNSYNMTAVSNVEFAYDAFHNFASEGEITYSVDFDDTSANKGFAVNAAAQEGTTGKIVMRDSSENVIAEFDLTGADGNFKTIEAVSNVALSGTQNVSITYEGEGSCSIKNIDFFDYIALADKLDTTNYSATSGSVNADGPTGYENYFGGLGSQYNNTKWDNVYFDDEGKLWDVTLTYAIPSSYSGSDVTIYADSIGGPVIAKAVIVNQTDMGWNKYKTVKVPVTYMPEGFHDVYVKVTLGDYSAGGLALNLESIKFSEYTGEEKYRVDYRTIAKGTETTPLTVNAVLTFVADETSPANYIFTAAIYDKTTGQLVDVKPVNGTTVEGLNTASIVYNYADVAGYNYKYFVWDGTTLKPLQAEAFSNEF